MIDNGTDLSELTAAGKYTWEPDMARQSTYLVDNSLPTKEDEISKLKQAHEFEINHLAHANLAWQEKCRRLEHYDVDELPNGNEVNVPERIVCAATKFGDLVIPSVRHFDELAWQILDRLGDRTYEMPEQIQGFVTNHFRFVDRNEAWHIAVEQKQIVRRVGGDKSNGGTLYSENLY
ncbi:putative polynucleotide kinase [Acinetobacter phage vB_AbaM_Lazarus]|uniref:Putative polynucleotide kinase n=1 Tax=Acinetobacter phage vB_AbaM_Lazarus TaxID=2686289 RepID=A0A6B9SVR8_9CAUD|nr:putative polynucleotide kinase [Acinetobacter phage vB_AbaM_Lazarus]QHJ74017.1 putative polynucleotide kinase [Acinetobacter phage vB_AbaM_Lazarus]